MRRAAEAILTQLEQADSHVPLQGLRQLIIDLWSELDLKMSDLATAAAIAITQVREPELVVDSIIAQFTAAFRKRPEDLRDKVTAASHDLVAATRPIASQPASPANERMRDLEQLAREVARLINEADWGEPVVQHFAARYRELLGVDILHAEEIDNLFRAGDAFRSLFEREMPIVLIAACEPTDARAIEALLAGCYEVLVERRLEARVSHVGRFSAMGAQGAAYRAAERVERVERIGVCAPVEKLLTMPMAAVHKGALLGKSLGDETWLFREMAQRGVAIVLGGDDQSLDEAREILTRAPSRAICCDGFGLQSHNDIAELAGTTNAHWIHNAPTDPAAGRRLGEIVSGIFEANRSNFYSDPLLSLAWREHRDALQDAVDNLFENSGRWRIVRLVGQASHGLERAGVPSERVWCEAAPLAQKLAQRVLDIPNPQSDPSDNARWQERAKEVFRTTGSPALAELEVEQDIKYASRVGIKQL